MTPNPLAFVPADGALDVAITIAVAVIAVIGWIVKLVGQFKPAEPPRPPINRPQPIAGRPAPAAAARPRDERLQSEIDAFLRDVATGRKPARPAEIEEDAIEVIEEDEPQPARRPVSAAPAGHGPPLTGQMSEWDRDQQQRRERLLSTLSQRHLESTQLGAELGKHVEAYRNESVELRREKEQVERRLAETRAELQAVRAAVAAGGGAAPVASGPGGTSRFAALLKNRRSVKDAIVINEVLGRPKAMTRGR